MIMVIFCVTIFAMVIQCTSKSSEAEVDYNLGRYFLGGLRT